MQLSRLPYTQNGALFSFRSQDWHRHKQGIFADTTNRSATVAASVRKAVSHSIYISTSVAKECTLINLDMWYGGRCNLWHTENQERRPRLTVALFWIKDTHFSLKTAKFPPQTQITTFAFSNTDKNMKWLPTARMGWKVPSESCQSQKHGF